MPKTMVRNTLRTVSGMRKLPRMEIRDVFGQDVKDIEATSAPDGIMPAVSAGAACPALYSFVRRALLLG